MSSILNKCDTIDKIAMMVPGDDKEHTDYIDFLADACKKTIWTTHPETGEKTQETVLDWKKIYYKTQLVNSNTFSRFVQEIEDLEGIMEDCPNHMSKERSEVMQLQLISRLSAFRLSIDAKSSETIRNKDNTMSSLTHLMTKRVIERNYNAKEEAKNGLREALGLDKNKDANQN